MYNLRNYNTDIYFVDGEITDIYFVAGELRRDINLNFMKFYKF